MELFQKLTSAEVLEENNYYPFGMKHDGYNALVGNASYAYQYNGKELQKETGWNDYGARMYMPEIGRWGVIDPLAEALRRYTPYNYGVNNPVMFIDPDGRLSQSFLEGMMSSGSGTHYNTGEGFSNGLGYDGRFGGSKAASAVNNSLGNNENTNFNAFNIAQFGDSGSSLSGWMQNNIGDSGNNTGDCCPDEPATPWSFDKKGEELLNHWLRGSGKNLNFEYDKSWGDYMSKNGFLLERLQRIARSRGYAMHAEGKTNTTEMSGNNHFEIDNTYNTGYGMLHGTKYFSYTMNGKYDKSTDSYIFNFDLRWKDQINHNKKVLMDRVFSGVARAVGHPADYWITIKWTQTITVKNGVWTDF